MKYGNNENHDSKNASVVCAGFPSASEIPRVGESYSWACLKPTGCGMKTLSRAAVPSPALCVTNLEGHSSGSVHLSFVAGSLTHEPGSPQVD